jgi:AbiU2
MNTFEALYGSIDRSIGQIFSRWMIYNQLFGSGQESVDLLNKNGSYVFHLLQRLLLDDTILSLSRLADPPKTGKHENASIRSLVSLARVKLTALAASDVDALLASFESHVSNVKVHRDKAIAHADLDHATGLATLPEVSYSEIEGAMRDLEAMMLRLGSITIRRVGGYSPVIAFGTDGNKLLDSLRRCVQGEGFRP